MASESTASRIEAELLAFAHGYPEATEEFPWGDRVVKVKGKVFVFMGSGGDAVHTLSNIWANLAGAARPLVRKPFLLLPSTITMVDG